MAEKQNDESMVNAQDNDEWVQTKIEVPPPMTAVQPPMTPVIVKQDELPYGNVQPIYVATPDDVLAQHLRVGQTKVNILLIGSCVYCYIALFNMIDLIDMEFNKAAPEDIAFAALKMTVGLVGAIMLATKKFTAIKAYAFAFMLVYGCYVGFFVYNVFAHKGKIVSMHCDADRHRTDRASFLRCIDHVWIALMWKGIFMSLFAVSGFVVTSAYATTAMRFMKAKEEREEAGETVIV